MTLAVERGLSSRSVQTAPTPASAIGVKGPMTSGFYSPCALSHFSFTFYRFPFHYDPFPISFPFMPLSR